MLREQCRILLSLEGKMKGVDGCRSGLYRLLDSHNSMLFGAGFRELVNENQNAGAAQSSCCCW